MNAYRALGLGYKTPRITVLHLEPTNPKRHGDKKSERTTLILKGYDPDSVEWVEEFYADIFSCPKKPERS